MRELLLSLQSFMETGGSVLWVILLLSVVLWCLIIERFLFFNWVYPESRRHWLAEWEQRADKQTQRARSVRRCIISQANLELGRSLPIIKALINLCPLLGLLGTVTGMIHVFDAMAVTGTGNARAMASGVSSATIPTMAGMVIAIAGLYFSKRIEDRVSDESHYLSDQLKYQ